MWTRFGDMHSRGGRKLNWEHIYIEAPEAEARVIFYNRFGINPDRVSCTCCGSDYSATEYESLDEASAFERNDWSGSSRPVVAIEQYLSDPLVLVIRAGEIKPEERQGTVPSQGYIWVG